MIFTRAVSLIMAGSWLAVLAATSLGITPQLFASPAKSNQSPLKRLDPHGGPGANLKDISIEKNSECKVCHFTKAGKLQTKEEPDQFCASCHGALPHSGVAEHQDAGIACLSCHDPHRATVDGSPREPLKSSFLKLQHDPRKAAAPLPKGLVDRANPNAMMGHSCTECHDWN